MKEKKGIEISSVFEPGILIRISNNPIVKRSIK